MSSSTLALLVFGLASSGVAVIGFSWAFAMKWCRPRRTVTEQTPGDYDLPFESVRIASSSGELPGWFIPPGDRPFATAVVPHGWGSNAARMLPLAAMLREQGLAVLLFDARGHGVNNIPGPVTVRTFAEDLTVAVDHLSRRRDVDASRIAVVGHSMGGAAAIVAASVDSRIRAVVSSSSFAHPVTLTRRYLRRFHIPPWPFLPLVRFFIERYLGTSMTEVAPQNRIGTVAVPVLLLHGADDERIPASDMDTLYAAGNEATTQRVLLPARGHRDILKDPEYSRQVRRFLVTELRQVATAPSAHHAPKE